MFKRVFIIIVVSSLLVGCWDERLYKNLSVVSLVGIEGQIGEMKAYYAYPTSPDDPTQYVVIESAGLSPRDLRNNADLKVEQSLDLSELSTILISAETAKNPIYNFLDIYYRNPQNPITSKIALTEGSVKQYIDIKQKLPSDVGEYYQRFIESFERNTIFPKVTLKRTASLLFDKGKDLVLPYIKRDEEKGTPIAAGLSLFNDQVFTGTILDVKESLLLVLLSSGKATNAKISYLWENGDKKSPVSIDVIKVKRKWEIEEKGSTATIHLNYKLNVNIEEFPHDRLYEDQTRKELQGFLTKKVQEDVEKLLVKLQEAPSDALGIGRKIRAFHPKVWDEKWGEKFATLTLKPKITVSITRTGILE
ncbi:Ger(x)C family spore germination protein [Viridibacillus arvi]|uniref:Ger(x)C family spore germination protein n=1 Tax=Viridibacillus arvi TaxID=263475 RepID=UPI0034CF0334